MRIPPERGEGGRPRLHHSVFLAHTSIFLLNIDYRTLSTVESMEFLLGKLMGTKSNKDFLDMMNK